MSDILRIFLVLLVTAQTLCAQEVQFDDEEAARSNPERIVEGAASLIQNGLLDEAGAVLDKAVEYGADANNILFLRADIEKRRGNLEEAARIYREMLLTVPDALRVRLELGRVYFLLEDDAKAELQFRYVLAGDLPPQVEINVLSFIDRIRNRRIWNFTLDAALAPDSNVNAAPNERQIEIGGLPFELSDDARQSSGIGFEIRSGGRLDVNVNESLAWRQSYFYRHLEYEGSSFDDRSLFIRSGPLYRFPRNQINGNLIIGRRWFAGDAYSRTIGGSSDWRRRVTPRTDISFGGQATYVEHDEIERLDGPRFQLRTSGAYSLTTSSFLRGQAIFDHAMTESVEDRNWGLFAAVGYFVELPLGFNVYAEPGLQYRRFDAEDSLFGERREDVVARMEINLRNRQFDFYGFTPLIGFTYEIRKSTIDLYDFDRVRTLLGITREF